MSPGYTGRFAPSPTGPLHFGSLIAALASYLDARAHGGRWLVRMEDIDPPREVAGASGRILRQLENHGLYWDGDVLFQSSRASRYEEVLCHLFDRAGAYYCDCSRQDIQAMGGIYTGHCRGRTEKGSAAAAIRVCIPENTTVVFDDLFQGRQQQRLDEEVGDFVVRRKDGLYAYQLAVVVDDCDQGVTHVIRGNDLLDSTPRQIWLISRLGLTPPVYGHVPLALNVQGQKLSKQNHAPDIDRLPPRENLCLALAWLGIPVLGQLAAIEDILAFAIRQWSRTLLKGREALPAPECYRGMNVPEGG